MRLFFLALAAVLACAGPASARWLRAESADFVVYSDGDPMILKDYVARLEIFDALLRFKHGLPLGVPPARKLDIYLVRDLKQLQITAPQMGANIEGYYSATVEDIFAV